MTTPTVPAAFQPPIRSVPRLVDVVRLGLDREAERGYLNDIVETVQSRLDVPFVTIDVVLNAAQVFLAAGGPAPDWIHEAGGTPVEWALCLPMLADGAPHVFPDLRTDPLLRDNPLVTVGGIVSCAEAPLISHTGQVLGGICGLDVRPRPFGPDEIVFLQEMAAQAVERLEERASAD